MTIEAKILQGHHEFSEATKSDVKEVIVEGSELVTELAGLKMTISDSGSFDFDSNGTITVEAEPDSSHLVFFRGDLVSVSVHTNGGGLHREISTSTANIKEKGLVSLVVRNGRNKGIAEFVNTK